MNPKRQKHGGRQKGTKNKRTIERELKEKALNEALSKEGLTPLEFMLQVMRDEKQPMILRVDMAKAAAPYLHAKRAPEDSSGNPIQYNLTITKADEWREGERWA